MEILFFDKHILVCVKPVGIDSEHDVPQALSKQLGGEVFPIHRLDKNVGGVMVFARTKSAAAALSRSVQEGTMVKEYIAMVHGVPETSGDWTDLLFKDSSKNKVFVVKKERKGVKTARLEYVRLTDCDPATVRVRLHTGRSHQIRVQFASRGFPLLGDHKYGARDEHAAPRLFSCRLTFPFGGKNHCYTALPDWATAPSFL
jgi:23S rRNA pseudouridine1911/1915/1917 synthase